MRGMVKSLGIEVDGVPLWATMHMDKAPLTLVHTCGSIVPGPPRYRTWAKYVKSAGKVIRRKYTLE